MQLFEEVSTSLLNHKRENHLTLTSLRTASNLKKREHLFVHEEPILQNKEILFAAANTGNLKYILSLFNITLILLMQK